MTIYLILLTVEYNISDGIFNNNSRREERKLNMAEVTFEEFMGFLIDNLECSDCLTKEEKKFLYDGIVDNLHDYGEEFTTDKMIYFVCEFPDEWAMMLGYDSEEDLINSRRAI